MFFLHKRLGYRPINVKLFYQAVTHKSRSNNVEHEISNERLEFLGDAILDAVVAEFLFDRFPDEDEGYLTKIKSKIVSRKTLSEIAEEMELRQVLRYQRGRSINLNSLEGNALEALIGAVYMDGGFKAVRTCVRQHIFRNYMDLNRILVEEIDFKSKLFIWSQKMRLELEFTVLKEENIKGVWEYTIMAKVNGTSYGQGIGSTKKMAEQVAAKETLELMGEI
jgi:ribonuclease-3